MKFKRAKKRFDVSEIKLSLCMVLIAEVFALVIELTWCYNANAEFMKNFAFFFYFQMAVPFIFGFTLLFSDDSRRKNNSHLDIPCIEISDENLLLHKLDKNKEIIIPISDIEVIELRDRCKARKDYDECAIIMVRTSGDVTFFSDFVAEPDKVLNSLCSCLKKGAKDESNG